MLFAWRKERLATNELKTQRLDDAKDKSKYNVVIKDAGIEEVAEPFCVETADGEEQYSLQ